MFGLKYLLIACTTLLLVGCSPLGQVSEVVNSGSPAISSTRSPSSTVLTPITSETPQTDSENRVLWDLYPGLQAKLEQLSLEKNCDDLKYILEEFSNKDISLDIYLQKTFKEAGCVL
jgi:hypothetical protein